MRKRVHSQFDFRKNLKVIPLIIFGLFSLYGYTNTSTGESEIIKIKTFISKNRVHPGETFKVALLVKITPNWHIHAHELSDEFLIPTKLIFEEKEKIEVTDYYYPEPKAEKFEYSESELQIYDEEVILGALIKASHELQLGHHKLKGKFSYQPCDDKSCLPPKKIEFEISFEVVPLSQETEDIHKDIFLKLDFKKDHNRNQRISKNK